MDLNIESKMWNNKSQLLQYFKNRGEESLEEIARNLASNEFKEKASDINKAIIETKDKLISVIIQKALDQKWENKDLLQSILLVTYSCYVSMIDLRNSVWEYDYMTFSRRIGELWEPFCKKCFEYPIKKLELFMPPLFSDVKKVMTDEIENYIDNLNITNEQKVELKKYYEKVWKMVTSGEIKLELDLHFIQNKKYYNVDFKSGFGSNEKGNTNRLLLVATIYKNLEKNYNCYLFVRSEEEENNQYFRQLRDSGIWTAFCGEKTYDAICEFTGFDLKKWIIENIDWHKDLNKLTIDQFEKNGLLKYLAW
jgi:hypothetical protein